MVIENILHQLYYRGMIYKLVDLSLNPQGPLDMVTTLTFLSKRLIQKGHNKFKSQ